MNADVHKTDIAIRQQSDTNETHNHHTVDRYTEAWKCGKSTLQTIARNYPNSRQVINEAKKMAYLYTRVLALRVSTDTSRSLVSPHTLHALLFLHIHCMHFGFTTDTTCSLVSPQILHALWFLYRHYMLFGFSTDTMHMLFGFSSYRGGRWTHRSFEGVNSWSLWWPQ